MARRRNINRRRRPRRRRINKVRSPGAHPPVIQQGRWYSAVAQATGTATTQVTVNLVANSLRDFYGLYATDTTNRIPIKIRFKWIKAWQILLPADKITPIFITCSSLVDSSSTQEDLYNAYNYPAKNQFARVGFRWPAPHNKTVYDDGQTTINIAKIVAEQGAAYVYHVGVMWRPENGGASAVMDRLFNAYNSNEPESPFSCVHDMA